MRELGYLPKEGSGVYVSRWHHGSPAHRYGLYAMHWVLSVNGVATPDLDTFVRVVSALQDGEYVRVRVCHLESTTVKMLTIKPDLHYCACVCVTVRGGARGLYEPQGRRGSCG